VCRVGVGRNSIVCGMCKRWVHKKCLGVKGRLKADGQFTCPMCVSGGHKDAVQEKEVLLGDAGGLECVAKFCYLGDMLGLWWRRYRCCQDQGEMCVGEVQGAVSDFDVKRDVSEDERKDL
jgi:hypothetical protein